MRTRSGADPAVLKQTLRGAALERRAALTDAERRERDARIRERLFALSAWRDARRVLLYLSFGAEVDTWEIAARAMAEGKAVYAPRITDSRAHRMDFFRLPDLAATAPGFRGIREPLGKERFDGRRAAGTLMVQPGVAFSAARDRIGYGGGYYDRWLAADDPAGDLMNVAAICYDCQVIDAADPFPSEETDRRPQMILTESRIITDDITT